MRSVNVAGEIALLIKKRPELASFRKGRCLDKYPTVVRSIFA